MEISTSPEGQQNGTDLAWAVLSIAMVHRLEEADFFQEEDADHLLINLGLVAVLTLEKLGVVSDTEFNRDCIRRLEATSAPLTWVMDMLHILEKQGTLTEQDIENVFRSAMYTLEKPEFVSYTGIHAAHGVLSSMARERGIEMRKLN